METTEKQTVTLEKIEPRQLSELNGWREKQETLLKANPFIKIQDNKSYELAKKSRTALLRGRTEIEKQDKLIASRLQIFRKKVIEVKNELIAITLLSEQKQQDEVKRYEKIKEDERLERERKEKERIDAIKSRIEAFYQDYKQKIDNLTYEEYMRTWGLKWEAIGAEIDSKEFQEFEKEFIEKSNLLEEMRENKIISLKREEELRLEKEAFERKKREEQKEKERIENIESAIDDFFQSKKQIIENLKSSKDGLDIQDDFIDRMTDELIEKIGVDSYNEFEEGIVPTKMSFDFVLDKKIEELKKEEKLKEQREEIRKAQEKIAQERREIEAERKRVEAEKKAKQEAEWRAEKAREEAERKRKEQEAFERKKREEQKEKERIENIESAIDEFFQSKKQIIENLKSSKDGLDIQDDFIDRMTDELIEKIGVDSYNEFEEGIVPTKMSFDFVLDKKIEELKKEEKLKEQREEIRKAQEKIAQERREIEAERKRVEVKRYEKIKEDERLERERKEKEAKRKALEALKPDKEKMLKYINSLKFNLPIPEIKNKSLKHAIDVFKIRLEKFKNELKREAE